MLRINVYSQHPKQRHQYQKEFIKYIQQERDDMIKWKITLKKRMSEWTNMKFVRRLHELFYKATGWLLFHCAIYGVNESSENVTGPLIIFFTAPLNHFDDDN